MTIGFGSDFKENIELLEGVLGYECSKTTFREIKLTDINGEIMELKAAPGKYVSCAFMEFLSDGKLAFIIDDKMHETLKSFFGPLWEEPGHTTIDFLRTPGVLVETVELKTA